MLIAPLLTFQQHDVATSQDMDGIRDEQGELGKLTKQRFICG
jgi:hypothetical protein